MRNYTVKLITGESITIKARNSNLAYGLARKKTGKMPASVTATTNGNLWGVVGLISFSCVLLYSCAVMWG